MTYVRHTHASPTTTNVLGIRVSSSSSHLTTFYWLLHFSHSSMQKMGDAMTLGKEHNWKCI